MKRLLILTLGAALTASACGTAGIRRNRHVVDRGKRRGCSSPGCGETGGRQGHGAGVPSIVT
jgi:hypothetical protein